MNNEMMLSFVAIEENEALARMAMTCFITPLDPTIEEISEFKTIVSEAVTNAILHGYDCDGKSIVTIHATIEDDKVTMTVRDEGAGIANIEQAMEPMYTTRPHMERSGMGFTIMESFSDSLSVESNVGSGTVVKFEKRFSPVTETSRMR
ncbi:anti-sigma F factor [Sporosarcina pasteurii]|uniref:Anti-sigma F factor n=1 Tax=Sporosarcina pasteurii TaxID=1474 RepID=A0A380BL53_SPOPA|nr:anti-sigma F factor [Sporosarcina pasteurii]MDS9470779.1 anti-sigma F factor [Sporosarcina pasteurii]QBQ05552.1 anti-sigma F factor [Sporosarcina pasteurii]SUJ02261.1 Anti-sigma F factor [Sporosarcina pasteurii]